MRAGWRARPGACGRLGVCTTARADAMAPVRGRSGRRAGHRADAPGADVSGSAGGRGKVS